MAKRLSKLQGNMLLAKNIQDFISNNRCSLQSIPQVHYSSGSVENSDGCSMYDSRKIKHPLPENDVYVTFDPLPVIPDGVFRCTSGEILGPCAGKNYCYRNPEYFSFHHMTFYDMHLQLRKFRQPCADTKRKP